MFVKLKVNTNQYSRTFQDRSYVFSIKPLPTTNTESSNMGNIVSFPSHYYIFITSIFSRHSQSGRGSNEGQSGSRRKDLQCERPRQTWQHRAGVSQRGVRLRAQHAGPVHFRHDPLPMDRIGLQSQGTIAVVIIL